MAHSTKPHIRHPTEETLPVVDPGTPSIFARIQRAVQVSSQLYQGSPEFLRETYQPTNLLHRDNEVDMLVSILQHTLQGYAPTPVVAYGPAGSGKTATIRLILSSLQRLPGGDQLHVAYVPCANLQSDHAFLREVATAVEEGSQPPATEKRGTDALLESIKASLNTKGGVTVLVLDGIDGMTSRVGSEFLLPLLNLGGGDIKLGLVLISRISSAVARLGEKTRSRLIPELVAFRPYTESDLRDILRVRSKAVFGTEADLEGTLAVCSSFAAEKDQGSARTALSILRMAARFAEEDQATDVSGEHANRAVAELRGESLVRSLQLLDEPDRTLLRSILGMLADGPGGEIKFEGAYTHYLERCKALGVQPFKDRAARKHVDTLEGKGLLRTRMVHLGRNGGRMKMIQAGIPAGEGLRVLDGILRPGPR
jgi:cell division control protein 6